MITSLNQTCQLLLDSPSVFLPSILFPKEAISQNMPSDIDLLTLRYFQSGSSKDHKIQASGLRLTVEVREKVSGDTGATT